MIFKNRKEPFIIAEVGQNHQGIFDNAIKYIDVFSQIGADAIKFQNRNNKYLFAKEAYEKPYESNNAFGKSYGEHREHLELTLEEMKEIKNYLKKKNLLFISTPFDEPSLEFLLSINIDIIKIASFDIGNLPFINKIADAKKPTVVSIGGGKSDQVKSSLDLLSKKTQDIALLHCVSEYPCTFDRLGLENINKLKEDFPDITVGLSDHFNGILSGPIAYMMGAKVFEKHVTFNRAEKGTDHSFSLEPEGFRKFSRDIHRVPAMMKPKNNDSLGKEPVFLKLGKSIVPIKDISKGDVLSLENLSGKIFNKQYIPVRESNKIIGKKTNIDLKKGEPVKYEYLL